MLKSGVCIIGERHELPTDPWPTLLGYIEALARENGAGLRPFFRTSRPCQASGSPPYCGTTESSPLLDIAGAAAEPARQAMRAFAASGSFACAARPSILRARLRFRRHHRIPRRRLCGARAPLGLADRLGDSRSLPPAVTWDKLDLFDPEHPRLSCHVAELARLRPR